MTVLDHPEIDGIPGGPPLTAPLAFHLAIDDQSNEDGFRLSDLRGLQTRDVLMPDVPSPAARVWTCHSLDEILESCIANILPLRKWFVRDVFFGSLIPKHPQDLATSVILCNVLQEPIDAFSVSKI